MSRDRRDFAQPQWRGEPAEGRTLLIHAEQGFGDTLQFCRLAPLAAARGLRVSWKCRGQCCACCKTCRASISASPRGEALPDFDLHCPMLSLPLALGTTLETIPAGVPYLHADAAKVADWQARLAGGGRPEVRASASPGQAIRDRLRPAASALAPDRLAPLFGLPGAHFFSLQKDGPAAPEHFPLTDFMDEMGDFADTAALIANLDLVVTVDNAIAHLAGALGKPVWLLDRFDPDWRWLAGRQDSPWYPTLRIFRQPRPGDWDAVIAGVRAGTRRPRRGARCGNRCRRNCASEPDAQHPGAVRRRPAPPSGRRAGRRRTDLRDDPGQRIPATPTACTCSG